MEASRAEEASDMPGSFLVRAEWQDRAGNWDGIILTARRGMPKEWLGGCEYNTGLGPAA